MKERKVSNMRELNGDALFEKLRSMPSQKLSIEIKNRIIRNIRSSGAALRQNHIKARQRRIVCTAAAVFIAAVVFSAVTFTEYGRQISSNLLADVRSMYNGSNKGQKITENMDEKVTITPSPSPAADSSESETKTDPIGANSYLQYIKMIDKNWGWAVSRVSVFRTDDGGTTWKDVSPKNRSGNFAGEYFLDKDNGWVAFSGSDYSPCTIFRTSDGGATWKQSPGSIKSTCLTFYFNDGKHGWAIAHKDLSMHSEEADILKTSDGGLSWSIISSSNYNNKKGALPFYGTKTGISFNSLKSGWISGDVPSPGQPYFYHSSDGGHTWKAVNLKIPENFKSSDVYVDTPIFSSESDGIVPVQFWGDSQSCGIFYLTGDGGNTWKAGMPVNFSRNKNLFWNLLNIRNGFAFIGADMYMTEDSGKTWSKASCKTPMEDISQINFTGKTTGLAVSQGILFETDDGGQTWYKKPTNLLYLPCIQMTVDTKDEDAAKALLTEYLDHYKGEGVLKAQKITGYRIDEIKVTKTSDAGFTFNAKFSVQCTDDSTYWTSQAKLGSDGWTGQEYLTVNVSKIYGSFTITSVD